MLSTMLREAREWQAPATPSADDFALPPGIVATLLPHQREVVHRSRVLPRQLLALDTGVGKTVIAIVRAVDVTSTGNNVLVVCPASLKDNWRSELARFAPDVSVVVAKNTNHVLSLQAGATATVFVISYALLSCVAAWAKALRPGLLVCDEAHYVKHCTSARAKAVAGVSSEACILLTATPGVRNAELWHLLRIVDPVKFAKFHHYRMPPGNSTAVVPAANSNTIFYYAEHFTVPCIVFAGGGRRVYDFKQNQHTEELHVLIRPHMVRMLKKDVLDLPTFSRERIVLAAASKRFAKHTTTEMARAEELRKEKGENAANAVISELLRATMRAKTQHVIAYINMMLEATSEKFIVFVHHQHIGNAIIEALEEDTFIAVNGSTPMKTRSALFERFEKDDTCRVGVLSLGACSTGLTLVFVQLVLVCELVFDATRHVQAEARCYRHGQTLPVTYQYLLLGASTDELVFSALEAKRAATAVRLDGEVAGGGGGVKRAREEEEEEEGEEELEIDALE